MSWLEALILGIVQGLTEFLPVSSSGHIELGKIIMSVPESDITFTVVVHGATVLSTIVVFWKEIQKLIIGVLQFKWNDEMKYFLMIVISMIPAVFVGLLLEDKIDAFFMGNLLFVGLMLLVTSALLGFTYYAKQRENDITMKTSAILGIAQAIAILPGISRSGATIATGLLLGGNKSKIAQFSFLMVIPLIIGANLKKIMDFSGEDAVSIDFLPLIVGFVAAFISGLFACKLMIDVIKRGKLIWFSIYCFIVGSIAIIYSLVA
jgi:undecaprenyl-diphosphatase